MVIRREDMVIMRYNYVIGLYRSILSKSPFSSSIYFQGKQSLPLNHYQ